jgi:hypothetical protein
MRCGVPEMVIPVRSTKHLNKFTQNGWAIGKTIILGRKKGKNGRVTVFLEEDKRTIRKIEQEVSLESIGCRTGHDFNYKIAGTPLPKKSNKMIIWGAKQ